MNRNRWMLILSAPFVLTASIAAAVGSVVRGFPRHLAASWRLLGPCVVCEGSGMAQHLKDLDGDPACDHCSGSGSGSGSGRGAC